VPSRKLVALRASNRKLMALRASNRKLMALRASNRKMLVHPGSDRRVGCVSEAGPPHRLRFDGGGGPG
jgi:hypothetical protein